MDVFWELDRKYLKTENLEEDPSMHSSRPQIWTYCLINTWNFFWESLVAGVEVLLCALKRSYVELWPHQQEIWIEAKIFQQWAVIHIPRKSWNSEHFQFQGFYLWLGHRPRFHTELNLPRAAQTFFSIPFACRQIRAQLT